MKRAWMAAGLAVAATFFSATGARADEPPTVVDASRVTFYLELDGVDAAKVEALATLLKREFPKAQVELIEGTLRIQTDVSTLDAIEKVLHSQRAGLPVQPGKRVKIHSGQAKQAEAGERRAKDARPRTKVKVGDLCDGCADCLAAVLAKEFPDLEFVPREGVVEVFADREGQAAVEEWLTAKRAQATEGTGGRHDAQVIVPSDRSRQAVIVNAGELGIGPEALGALRERLERVKAPLDSPEGAGPEREVLEGVRQRLAEALERVEAGHRVLARGGGSGGGAGGRGARPQPPRPPERPDAKAGRPEGDGPLAEFRARLRHLEQAREHLNAAGFERLAKQVAEGIEQVKAQAEEAAKRVRAAEALREALVREGREKRMAHERELAREREEAQRAAGIRGPATSAELRSEELVDLVRALHQQVNAMREELKALREQVGRDRPAPR